MMLRRASRKLFLVTLPTALPVGLKRALMRSRKKYIKQQKYTTSMKMNSFLDLSEEQGCARNNISDVLAGYFGKTGTRVLFHVLFYLVLPTDLSKSLLNWNTLQMLLWVGDNYSSYSRASRSLWTLWCSKAPVHYPQWFHHHLKRWRKTLPVSLQDGRHPGSTTGVGWASSSQQYYGHWCPWGFAFQTFSGKWGNLATGAREGESQLIVQAWVLKLQRERLLEVCHGKSAHGVNLCHLTWDLFCLILDN